MKPLVSLRAKLDTPSMWLGGPASRGFAAALHRVRRKLDDTKRGAAPVVVAERTPAAFLAAVLAAIEQGRPVVLASPRWSSGQRLQAAQQIRPALWLGQSADRWPAAKPIRFDAHKFAGAILIPTGGTGGSVRWAVHTWATLSVAAAALGKFLGATHSTHVSTLPPWHVSGLMPAVRALAGGGKLWLENWKTLERGIAPAISPDDAVISLVPTQLERLLRKPRVLQWLRGTRAILLGGAVPTEDLLRRAKKLRLPVALAYGLTETAAVVAAQRPADFLRGAPPLATALPHAKIWVQGEGDARKSNRKTGRIWIQAKSLFRGYYPQLRREKKFATEDFGEQDSLRRIRPLGRLDRVINSGGEKINPAEVETAIRATGLVRAVRVIGQPDAEWGERVVALYTGQKISKAKMRAALAARLPRHARPKTWLRVASLFGSGKFS